MKSDGRINILKQLYPHFFLFTSLLLSLRCVTASLAEAGCYRCGAGKLMGHTHRVVLCPSCGRGAVLAPGGHTPASHGTGICFPA